MEVKNHKRNLLEADPNILHLKPISCACFYRKPIIARFCSTQQQHGRSLLSKPDEGEKNIITFIPQRPRQSDQTTTRKKWQSKSEQNQTEESYIPKPTSNYCQVCRNKFPDYLRHIKTPYHTNKVKNSHFHKQIVKFTQDLLKESPYQQELKFCIGRKKIKKQSDCETME